MQLRGIFLDCPTFVVTSLVCEESGACIQNAVVVVSTPTEKKEKDWFQHQDWLENPFTENCWHVEDICHSAHCWFYNPLSNVHHHQHHHQPPFTINFSHDLGWPGRPGNITVQAPDPNRTIHGKPITSVIQNTCTHSPIPNHLFLQAFYNDMLGEFYSRSIPFLHLIYKSSITTSTKNQSNLNSSFTADDGSSGGNKENDEADSKLLRLSFLEKTQMYLHVPNFPQHGKMLDSHHVFTETFRSNPLLSVTSLLDNSR